MGTARCGDARGKPSRYRRASIVAVAAALALLVCAGASAPIASASTAFRVHRLCRAPTPGRAQCMGMKLVPASLSKSQLHADAVRQAREAVGGATPAVTYKTPFPGYLSPQRLRAAYGLPAETVSDSLQTIALVDAFDDPSAEADLGVFDKEYGLPACTSANGCFRKVNQEGNASPLPEKEGEWASEISIDVQMAHSICQSCRILLVEASNETFADLGTAVNAAIAAGATEVSNSYAGPERSAYVTDNTRYYNHPGVVVAAASGDCGYLNRACTEETEATEFPADSPDVVAVGGTSLSENEETEAWTSTVWDEGGSGCSTLFDAPAWQSSLASFAATGCGSGRSVADVAAVGDPETGVDVYDSTPEGNGEPTGWGVWGGTSVATPIVAAEFALDGGAHGVSYPAATLYSHLGQSADLYDVVSGQNGSCAGTTICAAAVGYDGPSGVGSPLGLGAFTISGSPLATARPTLKGNAEQGETLTATAGTWSPGATATSGQWELCNSSGNGCAPIAGATERTLTLPAADVGSTVRFQETASNSAGAGPPSDSVQSAAIASNVPVLTGFTPAGGITGSYVILEGSALAGATSVTLDALPASFKVLSASQVQVTVPNGAKPGRISLTTATGTVTSKAKYKPTLSITGFSPQSGSPGAKLKIKGVGFNSSSVVTVGGVSATVISQSAKKLTVYVPTGAAAGPIAVANTETPAGTVYSAGDFTP